VSAPLHRHLERQLRKLALCENEPPSPAAWRELLSRISQAYEDVDRERYTLERSVSLFEKEMLELHAKLEESRDRMHSVFQASSVGFLRIEKDGTISMANPAMEKLLGYGCGELLNEPYTSLIHPDDRTKAGERFAALMSGATKEGYTLDKRFVHKKGSVVQATVSVSADWNNDDVPGFAIAAVQNVSGRARLEGELRHAQKLESVGRLAAGIAHEINTPIQFVGDNTEFLRSGFADILSLCATYRGVLTNLNAHLSDEDRLRLADAEASADLGYLESNVPQAFLSTQDGIKRVAKIVQAMKAFAHPDQGQEVMADLNEAVRSTLTVGNNELKYVADVQIDLGPLPPVRCHLGDLNQVFLNLLVNAAHAIGDVVGDSGRRGQITVSTRQEGPLAVIAVSDTGTGIPEAIRDRIFEPFFTTKSVGRGTGQGLALARSVVEKHGGTLTFDTVLGQGTTFYVKIPLGERPRDDEAPSS